MALHVDGVVGARLRSGDGVTVKPSAQPVRLIQLPETDFYRVVSEKLKWSGTSF